MTTYTRAALERIPAGSAASSPIFIVGMPRTGTTLVERILATGPGVASIGEAMEFPWKMMELAQATQARHPVRVRPCCSASLQHGLCRTRAAITWPRCRRWSGSTNRTIDKLPFNFRYCGLIHKALPAAKIVHLTRDPMDTCYAVYKTVFVNMYHYSYQLDETGRILRLIPADHGPLARRPARRDLRRQL